MANNFESLEVWKECRLFRKQISSTVKTFPIEENWLIG